LALSGGSRILNLSLSSGAAAENAWQNYFFFIFAFLICP